MIVRSVFFLIFNGLYVHSQSFSLKNYDSASFYVRKARKYLPRLTLKEVRDDTCYRPCNKPGDI